MQAKRFEYLASLERDGSIRADGASALTPDAVWTPEHLLLAAIPRCVLKSLRFFARDAAVDGSAQVAGVVSQRDEDGVYALVEVELLLEVEIDPAPPAEELPQLLGRAEKGCFVGNSLATKPRYVWRVNGRHAEGAA